ncbi:MAG TPA: HIT domain-containing protein [candidate division Zixibacteria bacterium]|nr:HIT domain-containing protein [candidate division Zixibacteria bacterium]
MANENIWAPWRAGFVLGKAEGGCVFCKIRDGRNGDDRQALVLKRGRHNYIVMNKFPYTSGHLLVTPNRHIGTLEKMTEAESAEHMRLVRLAAAALKRAIKPHGLNVGMNLGRVAGAGVLNHIHTHLVPRFTGDSNFVPVIGGVRVQSIDLEPVYDALLKAFAAGKRSSR